MDQELRSNLTGWSWLKVSHRLWWRCCLILWSSKGLTGSGEGPLMLWASVWKQEASTPGHMKISSVLITEQQIKWSKKQKPQCLLWPNLKSYTLSFLQILLLMHASHIHCRKRLHKGINTTRQRPLGSSWRLATTKRFHGSGNLEPKVLLSNAQVILIFNSVSWVVAWVVGEVERGVKELLISRIWEWLKFILLEDHHFSPVTLFNKVHVTMSSESNPSLQ